MIDSNMPVDDGWALLCIVVAVIVVYVIWLLGGGKGRDRRPW